MRIPEPGDVAALAAELLGVSTDEALDRLDLDAVRTGLSLAVGVARTSDQVAVLLHELVGPRVLGEHSAGLALLTVVHFLNEDKLDLDLSGDLPVSVRKLLDGVITGTTTVGDLSTWVAARLTRTEENQMFERFTDRARRVLVLAQDEARLLQHNFIGTEHILLGLVAEGEGVAAVALRELGISMDAVRAQVTATIGPGPLGGQGLDAPPFTPRAKKTLELALREALQLGHNYIGTEHMLLGIIREGEGVGAQVLTQLGADLVTSRAKVLELLTRGLSGTRSTTDPLEQLYLADVEAKPTLGDDEVRALFEQVVAGRHPEDDDPETVVAAGQAAEHALVEAHLTLVPKIAEAYRRSPVPQLDLIQQGNLGLMRAVEKFDPKLGQRFDVYATWWIRRAIEDAVMVAGAATVGESVPHCPQCRAPFPDRLAVRTYSAMGGAVRLVWCLECGATVGGKPPELTP